MSDYPRVTEILQAVGIIDYSKVPLDKLEFARTRGSAVHKACQLYDAGMLNMNSIDPRILPYLEGWKEYRKKSACEIICAEQPVFSHRFHYRGTLDRVIRDKHGLAVIEIKTTYTLHKAAGLQLAAYQTAYREGNSTTGLLRRSAVLLQESGEFKIVEYTEPGDFNVFLSALNIVNWRKNEN